MKIIPIRYQWREIWVGMQVICGFEKCVLIDSGIDDALSQALLPELKRCNIPLSSLALVINTHTHADHDGCNEELRQCTDADFAGADCCSMYDIVLSDGMEMKIDDIELEIIHTPGHSPDSICVIEKSTGTLFSGDSIQGNGIKELGLPLWKNSEQYRASLNKLLDLYNEGRYVRIFFGHEFQPSAGVVSGGNIPNFLQSSITALNRYTEMAEKLKNCEPQEFYNKLLDKFKLTPSSVWESTSRAMAIFLYNKIS